MPDIVLRDIDPVLAERLRRVGEQRNWSPGQTLLELLERGLDAVEGDGRMRFDHSEADVLHAAIAAMEGVPDDPGFALIGRAGTGSGDDRAA